LRGDGDCYPEVGGIDDDILLTINHDVLREKLLNVNLFISKIEALNANPTLSFDCKTKSPSTSLNSLLEETNTFDNSLPEFETFCFDVEEISSNSATTPPDISLPEYEVFHDDHVKEISSGNNFGSRNLWDLCEAYGKVVDVFIPNRKSKAGKRFAFVRFIRVVDMDRLIGSGSPALVLDDSCVNNVDLSRNVMGRVKELNSIPNLRNILMK
nr:UvrD-like helicase, ATP-binding domain, P-loop containing nucleoside triphosphate hydrolase [Tanacetum cinerariifolium]